MVDNSPIGGVDYRRHPIERRGSPRFITVLQTAKVITGQGEEICILKNISETGLRAEVYSPLAVGDGVSFELRTLQRIAGKVIWTEGHAVGVAFAEKVCPEEVLGNRTLNETGLRARPPRLRTDVPAFLRIDGVEFAVRLCNVSLGGAGIRVGRSLLPGQECELTVAALHRKKGYVRWYGAGEAGIVFARPIGYPEFSEWRAMFRNSEPPCSD